MQNKKAILLVGSPKVLGSSSENLGKLLLRYLSQSGCLTDIENISVAIRKDQLNELCDKVNNSDIVIISSPLYVDSLPAPVTYFLEEYTNDHKKEKKLIGIINSGFPEPEQNNIANDILRLFAEQNGMNWIGGFCIGGGGALNNSKLETSGISKGITQSFKTIANCLSNDLEVSRSIFTDGSKLLMPKSIYIFFAHIGWYSQAIRNRSLFKLWAKPY